jgi:DNA-binding NarL/FixJ family response regulator
MVLNQPEEFADLVADMKISITNRNLLILRKAVYGLNSDQIANELMITPKEVEVGLKNVLKTTQSKEPLKAIQILAKNGFEIIE